MKIQHILVENITSTKALKEEGVFFNVILRVPINYSLKHLKDD